MKVTSSKTRTVEYRTDVRSDGQFSCREEFADGELISQHWSVKGGFKKSHPTAYEPTRLHFNYYPDIEWLNTEVNSNQQAIYDILPEPELITDWDEFKGFDHLLCVYLGMDGNIYRINTPDPVPLWRKQDYIGGFREEDYTNIVAMAKELEEVEFIRNVEIIQVPHYNGGGRAIEFDYRLADKLIDFNYVIAVPEVAAIAERYRNG